MMDRQRISLRGMLAQVQPLTDILQGWKFVHCRNNLS